MARSQKFDVVIVGAGLAGLTMANALSKTGLEFALVAPATRIKDGRSTALLSHSVDYLKELGLWDKALPNAAPMSTMRLIDNTHRLLHAPETAFKSMEIGLETFGYNILNADLSKVLSGSLKKTGKGQRLDDRIVKLAESDHISLELASGTNIQCDVVIGADGRSSTIRKLAQNGTGIGVREWQYPQSAVVLNFKHTLPHFDASTEFHNSCGPFTVVPLADGHSSLVWVVRPETAEEITALNASQLAHQIEVQMHSILGKIEVTSDVQAFPLSAMVADKMAAGHTFLVGDAGHGFPPIGAQGYNLGIRDIALLAQLLGAGIDDLAPVVERYNAKRKNDVASRTYSVDLFNRSLLSDFLPMQMLRAGGISALAGFGPLRKFAMREGVSPGLGMREISNDINKFVEHFRAKAHS